MKLQNFRREYLQGGLRREQLSHDPILQFEGWLQQAIDAELPDPTAMTIATVDAQGQPSQRIVLLKQVDQQGFVFFTNTHSQKAESIAANHKVSLHFPWYPLERQVEISGQAVPLSQEEISNYFMSRPKESQLAAWASQQSQAIPSRDHLLAQYHAVQEKYENSDIPLPDFWGGYRIVPTVIEFWQGGAYRLHDRFQYTRAENDWVIERLAP